MMAGVSTKFFVILILSAVALADKAPGYDPQPLPSAQGGYKVAPEAPKPGPAPAPLGPSYTSFEYNTVNQGKDLSGGFSGSNFGPSAFSASSSSGANAGGYGPPDTSYGPPSTGVHGGNYPAPPAGHENSYTYYYQHYPAGNRPGHAVSPGDESIFDGLGDGFGLAGLGGLGGLGGVVALAKGILAIKPLLIIGLLLLLAVPLLLFFLPIPIITVSNLPGLMATSTGDGNNGQRQYPTAPSMFSSYLSSITERVLSSDECLERIICKLPQAPHKFQGKAKIFWETYGKKYFSNARIHRAMNAYFEESTGRSRINKCNQKFKCAHKFI